MKAITFDRFGGPEVLTISELPVPQAGDGEVLVKVAASTVNPTDIMMRDGTHAPTMRDLKPPFITGIEFSGTILEPGNSGLGRGQPVIGVLNPRTPRGGAYAEIIAVSQNAVAPLPQGLDLIAAATAPMNALTAVLALEFLQLKSGDTLLVTGGAGLLGGSAIQLARLAGLTVLANVGEKDRELVRSMGADHILPRDDGLEEALRAICPDGVDGMIDGALIAPQLAHLVRDGGGVVLVRTSTKLEDPRLRVHTVLVSRHAADRPNDMRRIAALIGSGELRPRVAAIYSWRDAAAAHAAAEAGGQRGRIVIAFDR